MSAALDDALRMLREARARADAAEEHICAADLAVEAADARATTAEAALAAERARVVALEEALAPFVAFADALAEHVPDNIAIGIFADGAMRFGPSGGCDVGSLRRARAARTTGESHETSE